MQPQSQMPGRIEDYALIGDCETAALCGNDGSIDWLCWPRFDSGACFASLLGTPDNGCWKLAPADGITRVVRRYRDTTLILETEFETQDGAITLVDFMPLRDRHSHLIRLVRGKRGRVRVKMELTIRFDYGRSVPWVTRLEDGTMRAIAGPDMVALRTPAQLRGENLTTISEFTCCLTEPLMARFRRRSMRNGRSNRPKSTGASGPGAVAIVGLGTRQFAGLSSH
jgi:GH15 family glucan-1,4-alpha-glucosidase